MNTTVLLTGITGFVGSHTAIQLLEKGYHVIGTLRNPERTDAIKKVIAAHTTNSDNLKIVSADLMDKAIWGNLTKNVDYVLHIASPFPKELPENEDEIITPALEGTLNVLKAAATNKVKRVVMTSSTTAMIYGKPEAKRNAVFSEKDWTDITYTEDSTSYHRSKTIAERAAWDFIKEDTSGLELTTVCPGLILGPVLEKDYGTSAGIVLNFLNGTTAATPNLGYDTVDVRSVADMHILAMESSQAAGERFVCANGFIDFKEILSLLKEQYPDQNIQTQLVPDEVIKSAAESNPSLQRILLDMGVKRKVANTKAIDLLRWAPIENEKAVLDCAESIIKNGLLD